MAGRTPAVCLYGPVALRAFALRSWLGHFGFRRFLLFGAYGVEAFPQRVHQVDDPGWCLDGRRDDLLMGPQFVKEFREIMTAIEGDEQVRVVVFDSAVEGFFLNHSDFLADFDELKAIPQGPTGLESWPDILVRLTHAPVVSIALIRGRATGNGSEIALACDMTFVSREKAVLSQWEVGVG